MSGTREEDHDGLPVRAELRLSASVCLQRLRLLRPEVTMPR